MHVISADYVYANIYIYIYVNIYIFVCIYFLAHCNDSQGCFVYIYICRCLPADK